jgi:hypothetical protein
MLIHWIREEVQMATIIAESKWPVGSSEKLAQVWLEMSGIPEWLKMIWAGTVGDINSGDRGLVLWQCDDSKIAEALFVIKNDVARYNVVPGYSCSVNVWTEPADALKMIGLG